MSLGLAVDHDALAARETEQIDALSAAADQHLEAAVHEALAMHARTDAGLVEQIDRDLLEHACANPPEHVSPLWRSSTTASTLALCSN